MGKLKKLAGKLKRNKRYIFLFIAIALLYILLLILFKYYNIKQEDIRSLLEPLGAFGIIGLYVVQVIFALTPLPDGVMPIIATITYGWQGFIAIYLGMLTAAIIHYFIAIKLGKAFIEKRYPKIKYYAEKVKGGNEIIKLIYIRVFSIVSFDVDAYVAGFSGINFKTYLLATALGLLPTNALLILASSGLFAESYLDYLNIGFWFIISLSVLAFWYKQSKINNN